MKSISIAIPFCIIVTAAASFAAWSEQTSPFDNLPIKDIRFWNENTGWAAGEAGVAYTTDGGAHWTLIPLPDDAEAIFFISESEGWVCGNDGMIRHSTNGGQTWIPQASGVSGKIRDIYFSDSQNGWACGEDGLLIATDDGGINWLPQTSPAVDDLRGIYMADNLRGWICGSDGFIIETINGGTTWTTSLIAPGTDELEGIHGFGDEFVWTVGELGLIEQTENGGDDWNPQTSGTSATLMDIYFLEGITGWFCGEEVIFKTTNGGANWTMQEMPIGATYNSIWFVREDLGFTVTETGRIFRFDEGPSALDPGSTFIPAEFAISSVYPNPFNTIGHVTYTVPVAQVVTLEIYDMLGRKVANVLSAAQSAGTHTATIDLGGNASGAYLLKLNGSVSGTPPPSKFIYMK